MRTLLILLLLSAPALGQSYIRNCPPAGCPAPIVKSKALRCIQIGGGQAGDNNVILKCWRE